MLYTVCSQNQCTQKVIGIYDPTVSPKCTANRI